MDDFFLEPSGPINAFGMNNNDEWKLKGAGIFKAFAPVVIPFLVNKNLDLSNKLWFSMKSYVMRGHSFEEGLEHLKQAKHSTLASKSINTLDAWLNECLEQPSYFQESLDKARSLSFKHDKELTDVFIKEDFPESLEEKIGRLFGRLEAAFCAAAPFYNLEAVIDDWNGFKWNPVIVAGEKSRNLIDDIEKTLGNKDDAIYMFEGMKIKARRRELLDHFEMLQILPSFLSPYVLGINNWNDVQERERQIEIEDRQLFSILKNLADEIKRPIEDIVFADYTIAFIQTKLKNQQLITRKECEELLKRIGHTHKRTMSTFYHVMNVETKQMDWTQLSNLRKYAQIVRAAEEENSLIRFFNWLPLIKSQDNFQGNLLTYSAVCDTTNQLIKQLKEHPEAWRTNEAYQRFLVDLDALKGVDPTSSKGRWILSRVYSNKRPLTSKIYGIAGEEKIKYLLGLR